jgi:MFS family permease
LGTEIDDQLVHTDSREGADLAGDFLRAAWETLARAAWIGGRRSLRTTRVGGENVVIVGPAIEVAIATLLCRAHSSALVSSGHAAHNARHPKHESQSIMIAAILSCWALLLGLGLLMLGTGLQGTLLGLRASLEGFPTTITGIVMSGYFAGFVLGALFVPRMVRNVGHVRVFAALASLASALVLLHSVFIFPLTWFALRVLSGMCMAGLFLITESWLNDIATNRTRGQLLSIYMVVLMGGMGLGQLLLTLADPRGFELFVLISVLISCALVPMLLNAGRAPEFAAPAPISTLALYRASPLGIIGSFSTGIAQGSVFGMGAVFGNLIGLSVTEVSLFMAVFALGAVVLQWPIGWLSDRFDRRKVIVATTAVSALLALSALQAAHHTPQILIIAIALYGGISVPLYSLFIAHTNDHLQPGQRVSASARLVMVNGFGAAVGPMLSAWGISTLGSDSFMLFLFVNHAAMTVFGLWRMTRSEPVPLDEQPNYAPMAPRGTPLAAGIASRTVRGEGVDDQESTTWERL